MKNLKKLFALLLVAAMLATLAACGTKQDETKTTEPSTVSDEREVKTKVAVLNGPTGLGLSKFKNDRSYAYTVDYHSDPQEIVPLVIKGEVDIAAVPLNLAANIYKKTNGAVQMIAISTLGVLHVLSADESIKNVADLKGKTVYATGQGSTPEYIINYILEKNGIDPEKDIDLQYKSAHNELATLAVEGKAEICILPEYFATKVALKSEKMKKVIDLTDEWNKVSEAQLAMGCYIARKEYIEANPEIIAEFIDFAEISTNYVNEIMLSTSFLLSEKLFETKEEAEQAVKGSNMVMITGEEMKQIAASNFEVLYNAAPAAVGGELPNDALYYVG